MASVVKALTMNGNVNGACLDGELCCVPTKVPVFDKKNNKIVYLKKKKSFSSFLIIILKYLK